MSQAPVTFRLVSEAERTAYDAAAFTINQALAWERWREHSCEEFNGGHPWVLTIDCGSAALKCGAGCGAEPYPDASEVLTGEFPVDVQLRVERHRHFEYPDEIDVWVEVRPRGA